MTAPEAIQAAAWTVLEALGWQFLILFLISMGAMLLVLLGLRR